MIPRRRGYLNPHSSIQNMPTKKSISTGKIPKLGAHCVPCEGGVPPLSKKESLALLQELTSWELEEKKIQRTFSFKDFKQSMRFVEKVAALAEKEGHHPDIHIHWNKVKLELWTHAIGGLSPNDFILAHKINQLH